MTALVDPTARRNDTQTNPPVTYLQSLDDISRACSRLERSGARAPTLRAASARTHTMLSLPPRPAAGPQEGTGTASCTTRRCSTTRCPRSHRRP